MGELERPDHDLQPNRRTDPDVISPDQDIRSEQLIDEGRRFNLHTCRPARGGGVSMRSWREEPTREPAHADALGRRLSPSRHKFRERASLINSPPFIISVQSVSYQG